MAKFPKHLAPKQNTIRRTLVKFPVVFVEQTDQFFMMCKKLLHHRKGQVAALHTHWCSRCLGVDW